MSKKEFADLETTIKGIPCGIVVDHYTAGRDWIQHTFPGAGPGDCEPPEPEEILWHVVDRKGYPASWLEDKIDSRECDRIEYELLNFFD